MVIVITILFVAKYLDKGKVLQISLNYNLEGEDVNLERFCNLDEDVSLSRRPRWLKSINLLSCKSRFAFFILQIGQKEKFTPPQ